MSFKECLGLSDFKPRRIFSLLRSLLAEFFGTLFIVFFGCGCALNFVTRTDIVQISFGFGLVVLAAVHFSGPVSGGHLNPALTLAMFAGGRIGLFKAFFYMIFQCLGGIAGSGLLYLVTPRVHRGRLGLNQLHVGTYHPNCSSDESDSYCYVGRVSPYEGFGVELICTFLLALVALSVTESIANSRRQEGTIINAPLAVGLTVTVCHLFSIPYTGCGINPARSLGPAVLMQDFSELGIFWLGPLVGAVLGALVHRLLQEDRTGCGRVGNNRDEYDITPGAETLKMSDKM